MNSELLQGLAVALGCGLLVGLERERRKGRGPGREVAGLRSFAVAALAGALAAWLDGGWLMAAALLSVSLLVAATRWGRPGSDPGLTTELALLAIVLIGALAMREPLWAAVSSVLITVLLAARQRMHHFARRVLREEELHDGLLLAALALLVLPLLSPEPAALLGGGSARQLGLLVLMLLMLQAAAHVALRLLGPQAGLFGAGLIGGFVSSTATVVSLGGLARHKSAPAQRQWAAAAMLSTAATWLQTLIMLGPIAPQLMAGWVPVALTGAAAALLAAWWVGKRGAHAEAALPPSRRPLRPREALALAALLTGVSVAVSLAQRQLGELGALGGALLAGLADAHAALPSLAALAGSARIDAATLHAALLLAIGANAITRSLVAWASGGWGYARWLVAALALQAAAAGAVAWALR
ncbi:DUF4010 domain-containing protein [Inhella sp.]|uniref:DUF4010 domain-containing protein n=1 Tax=Inhella sp. TaxID=1921806 RepID=UPI0035B354C2